MRELGIEGKISVVMFCSEIDLKNIVFRSVGSLHLDFIA